VVAVLGYEERYVPSESEMKLSDTGSPRAARARPLSPYPRTVRLPRGSSTPALSQLACAH
jgi:hypothetical protein